MSLPVIGVDCILSKDDKLWIVDVNSNPYIDYFDKTKHAYNTMEHEIKYIVKNVNE